VDRPPWVLYCATTHSQPATQGQRSPHCHLNSSTPLMMTKIPQMLSISDLVMEPLLLLLTPVSYVSCMGVGQESPIPTGSSLHPTESCICQTTNSPETFVTEDIGRLRERESSFALKPMIALLPFLDLYPKVRNPLAHVVTLPIL
jgi:hypothetical protein